MNRKTLLICAALVGAMALPALAAQDDQHAAHHPAAAPAGSPAAPVSADPMDEQMKAMAAMHERMMAAKSPAERKALMAEHEKLMRQGMAMMGGTGPKARGMDCDMGERHREMARKMEMMQAMMQMMMDRLPAKPE